MYKVLIIFCLIFLLEPKLEAQSGKYLIDTINNKSGEGWIMLTPFHITISQDSTKIVLPVTNVVKDNKQTYYFIAGCMNNTNYQGAAIFYNSEKRLNNGIRVGMSLYVEIRTKQGYSFTRFGLFLYE